MVSTTHNPLFRLVIYLWNNPLLAAFLVSGGLLLGAYGFQYIGGYEPCDLCWPQRYAHFAILGLSAAGLLLSRASALLGGIFAWATALGFGVSASIAGYHAGVEQKWWKGPTTCTASGQTTATDMDSLFDSMMEAKLVLCDDIPWQMFGISMAGYNFLLSLAMFLGLIFALKTVTPGNMRSREI